MKAILISIKPKYVAAILNGEKTIEIRKKFPKDYVGWVYIYCTKGKEKLCYVDYSPIGNKGYLTTKLDCEGNELNGKVVARFWCDNVEHIEYETCSRDISGWWKDNGQMFNHKDACLTYKEMFDYIGSGEGYTIHITNLKIFDEPKELSEFSIKVFPHRKDNLMTRYLTRAPQSFMFIEIE